MGFDMSRHIPRWLNDSELQRLDDRYEGIISAVHLQELRNRFTYVKNLQPVIVFEDGYQVVPNLSMRRALIEFWGDDTDDYIGRRLIVYRNRVERVDRKTGEVREKWEKRVMLPDPDPNVRRPRRPQRLAEASTDAESVAGRDVGLHESEIPWGQGSLGTALRSEADGAALDPGAERVGPIRSNGDQKWRF
jgi:hypothetical protein